MDNINESVRATTRQLTDKEKQLQKDWLKTNKPTIKKIEFCDDKYQPKRTDYTSVEID